MNPIQHDMDDFQAQVQGGSVRRAYRALLDFMAALRTRFQREYPDFVVSGLYQGYMDMTYFAVASPPLKQRGLKLAIVFNYETFRFEAWLAASNRQVQRRYWELVRRGRWGECRVLAPGKGVDAIIECVLVEEPDFGDLDGLTEMIEQGVAEFLGTAVAFLAEHDEV